MNDESNPPPSATPPPTDAPKPLGFAANPIPQVPAPQTVLEQMRTNSRLLQYVGAALIVLSLPLTWWSMTRYRISEQRGVDLGSEEQRLAIEKDMDEAEKKDYRDRLDGYTRAWTLNQSRFGEFYNDHLPKDYGKQLDDEMSYSRKSGTVVLRGWSTWTGWFGLVFVALLFAAEFAPKFSEDLTPIVWSFPLALAGIFGFFSLMTLLFYFGVPTPNDDGIAQGVGLGNYIAILGGLLATAGSVFEGIKSMNARLAELAAEEEEEEAETAKPTAEGAPAVPPAPKPKPAPKPRGDEPPPPRQKSRLEDW